MEHHLERASDAAFASVTATFARYAVETLRVLLDAPVLDIDSSDSIQTLRDFSNGPVRCLSVALGGGIDDAHPIATFACDPPASVRRTAAAVFVKLRPGSPLEAGVPLCRQLLLLPLGGEDAAAASAPASAPAAAGDAPSAALSTDALARLSVLLHELLLPPLAGEEAASAPHQPQQSPHGTGAGRAAGGLRASAAERRAAKRARQAGDAARRLRDAAAILASMQSGVAVPLLTLSPEPDLQPAVARALAAGAASLPSPADVAASAPGGPHGEAWLRAALCPRLEACLGRWRAQVDVLLALPASRARDREAERAAAVQAQARIKASKGSSTLSIAPGAGAAMAAEGGWRPLEDLIDDAGFWASYTDAVGHAKEQLEWTPGAPLAPGAVPTSGHVSASLTVSLLKACGFSYTLGLALTPTLEALSRALVDAAPCVALFAPLCEPAEALGDASDVPSLQTAVGALIAGWRGYRQRVGDGSGASSSGSPAQPRLALSLADARRVLETLEACAGAIAAASLRCFSFATLLSTPLTEAEASVGAFQRVRGLWDDEADAVRAAVAAAVRASSPGGAVSRELQGLLDESSSSSSGLGEGGKLLLSLTLRCTDLLAFRRGHERLVRALQGYRHPMRVARLLLPSAAAGASAGAATDSSSVPLSSALSDAEVALQDVASNCDPSDLTDAGDRRWIAARDRYAESLRRVDAGVVSVVTAVLAAAQRSGTRDDLLAAVEAVLPLARRALTGGGSGSSAAGGAGTASRVGLALAPFQARLVSSVEADVSALSSAVTARYGGSAGSALAACARGLPPVTGLVLWLQALRTRANAAAAALSRALGPGWADALAARGKPDLAPSLSRLIASLEPDAPVAAWVARVNTAVDASRSNPLGRLALGGRALTAFRYRLRGKDAEDALAALGCAPGAKLPHDLALSLALDRLPPWLAPPDGVFAALVPPQRGSDHIEVDIDDEGVGPAGVGAPGTLLLPQFGHASSSDSSSSGPLLVAVVVHFSSDLTGLQREYAALRPVLRACGALHALNDLRSDVRALVSSTAACSPPASALRAALHRLHASQATSASAAKVLTQALGSRSGDANVGARLTALATAPARALVESSLAAAWAASAESVGWSGNGLPALVANVASTVSAYEGALSRWHATAVSVATSLADVARCAYSRDALSEAVAGVSSVLQVAASDAASDGTSHSGLDAQSPVTASLPLLHMRGIRALATVTSHALQVLLEARTASALAEWTACISSGAAPSAGSPASPAAAPAPTPLTVRVVMQQVPVGAGADVSPAMASLQPTLPQARAHFSAQIAALLSVTSDLPLPALVPASTHGCDSVSVGRGGDNSDDEEHEAPVVVRLGASIAAGSSSSALAASVSAAHVASEALLSRLASLSSSWSSLCFLWSPTALSPSAVAAEAGDDLGAWVLVLRGLAETRDSALSQQAALPVLPSGAPSGAHNGDGGCLLTLDQREASVAVAQRARDAYAGVCGALATLLSQRIASLAASITQASDSLQAPASPAGGSAWASLRGARALRSVLRSLEGDGKGGSWTAEATALQSALRAVQETLAVSSASGSSRSGSLASSTALEPVPWSTASWPVQPPAAWAALAALTSTAQDQLRLLRASGRSVGADLSSADSSVSRRVLELAASWGARRPIAGSLQPSRALAQLSSAETELQGVTEEVDSLASSHEALAFLLGPSTAPPPLSSLPSSRATLARLSADVSSLRGVWALLRDVAGEIGALRASQWWDVAPKALRSSLDGLVARVAGLPPSTAAEVDAVAVTVSELGRWREAYGLLVELKSAALQPRHTAAIVTALGLTDAVAAAAPGLAASESPLDVLSLGALLDSDLARHAPAVRETVRCAQGELGVSEFLATLGAAWEGVRWESAPYRSHLSPSSSSGPRIVRVVRGWDTLLSLIDDHASSLASLRASPYAGPFAAVAAAWERRLTDLRALIDAWLDVQRRWQHLDGLFGSSGDIRLQLPSEYARFVSADAEVVALLGRAQAVPQVLAAPCLSCAAGDPPLPLLVGGSGSGGSGGVQLTALTSAQLLSLPPAEPSHSVARALSSIGASFDRVQAGLSEYLDRQRGHFPRFFFLGDDDLLELLGASHGAPAAPTTPANGAGAGAGASVSDACAVHPSLLRHLPRMFAGVASLATAPSAPGSSSSSSFDIVAVVSHEGERLALSRPVQVTPSTPLHTWLSELVTAIRVSLGAQVVRCYRSFLAAAGPSAGAGGGGRLASSVLSCLREGLTCEAIALGLAGYWTAQVEGCLAREGRGLQALCDDLSLLVRELSAALASASSHSAGPNADADAITTKGFTDAADGGDAALHRRRAEQLLVDVVHKRDVTRTLLAQGVTSPDDYGWRARLRTYVDAQALPAHDAHAQSSSSSGASVVTIRMGTSSFTHGLEYHGVGDRLVQTPLTDRAFLTLTHALALRLGGSPFGPAGTGKTETVKALGAALGRYVLVFNCDDAFDHGSMGRILAGLATVGAWGCFDEFNRLDERTLSAVSAQILAVQGGLQSAAAGGGAAAGGAQVELGGRSVTLHPSVGIFVTMNPSYAGRSQLPDNLKSLFRPCAMTAPDSARIAQVLLYTHGFGHAEPLAARVTSLFATAGDQLSRQVHYDWGLRALKTVLTSAGRHMQAARAARGNADANSKDDGAPSAALSLGEEAGLIVRSLLEAVTPKLVPGDLGPFSGMLRSCLPEAEDGEDGSAAAVIAALRTVCTRRGLVWRDEATGRPNAWFEKAVQLYHAQASRHGVMLVGPPGSGKSLAWRCLLDALSLAESSQQGSHASARADVTLIDPKALPGGDTKRQLYGHLDPATLEWSDGLLTATLRAVVANARGESGRRHWIVLDGEVDPEWAENLNSLLDDNRLLTLPSGERLPLPPNVRVIMEVDALRFATLATVSRCGMVWFAEGTASTAMVARRYVQALASGSVPSGAALARADRLPLADLPSHAAAAVEGGASGGDAPPLQARLCGAWADALREDLCGPSGLLAATLAHVSDDLAAASGAGSGAEASGGGPIMPVTHHGLATSTLALLSSGLSQLLSHYASSPAGVSGDGLTPGEASAAVTRARQWLILSLAWAGGAAFRAPARRALAQWLAATAKVPLPPDLSGPGPMASPTAATSSLGSPLSAASSSSSGGGDNLGPCLLDYQLDLSSGSWVPLSTQVASLEGTLKPSAVLDANLVVPTADTVRHGHMLASWLRARQPLVLCGPPGSGKTMILTSVLASGLLGRGHQSVSVASLSFSSATSPDLILRTLEQACEYRRTVEGWCLVPLPPGHGGVAPSDASSSSGGSGSGETTLIVFCDEVNLPSADKYGTQRVSYFLRQLIEQQGFWRPIKFGHGSGGGANAVSGAGAASSGPPAGERVWVSLRNVQFVGACNPPTDPGRVPLPPRFLRHAPVLLVDYPPSDSLLRIYGTLSSALVKLAPAALGPLAAPLAAACLEAYTANAGRFSATEQPHYVYSPRELSRWMRAMYEACAPQAEAGAPPDASYLARLWLHEGLRLFADRLVSQGQRDWCANALEAIARRHFGQNVRDIESVVARPVLFSDRLSAAAAAAMGGAPASTAPLYAPVTASSLRSYLEGRLRVWREEVLDVPLVLHDEAVQHIARIDRVLRQPLGHLLLAGASGCGKTVLTRFVAWLRDMTVFQVRLSHKYGLAEFDADLRSVMRAAGVERSPTAFIFDESNVLSSAFLERMNALLASGEVPGLFEGDDRAALLAACRAAPWASSSGDDTDSDDGLLRIFTRNIQRYLHVVFTMNPATSAFGSRRATSPALFNRCVVDWFGEWAPVSRAQVAAELTAPSDLAPPPQSAAAAASYALPQGLATAVAGSPEAAAREILHHALASRQQRTGAGTGDSNKPPRAARGKAAAVPVELAGASESSYSYRDAVVAALTLMHEEVTTLQSSLAAAGPGVDGTVPPPPVCPRDYVDLLHHFTRLFGERRAALGARQTHLARGLARIRATETQVADMRASLAVTQASLRAKDSAAAAKLAQMLEGQREAEARRSSSLQLSSALAKQEAEIASRQATVNAELAEAEPALRDAQASVQAIKKAHLDELRSMLQPPAPVKLTLEAVLVVLGHSPASLDWAEIRKAIKASDFIATVISYRAEDLKPRTRALVQERYISASSDFTFERINAASKACGPLYRWLVSQVSFSAMLERVEPLRREVTALSQKGEELASQVGEVNALLGGLEGAIEGYKAEYALLVREVEALRVASQEVAGKVSRAVALVDSLAAERQRWEASTASFTAELATMASDCAVGAAFCAYAGRFDFRSRLELEARWVAVCACVGVPVAPGYRTLDFLAPPQDRLAWGACGLASGDDLQLGNAVLLTRHRRFPFVVDPSGEALAFLRRMVAAGHIGGGNSGSASRTLVTASFADGGGGYLKAVESACRFGTALLLTDAEGADPILNPVLCREFSRSGNGRTLARIGDAEVDVSPSFSLFLSTSDASARLPADIASRVTLVSFSVTTVSLQSNVLGRLLAVEQPAIAAQRARLLRLQSEQDARLRGLEERLLSELAPDAPAPEHAAPAAGAGSRASALPTRRGAASAAASAAPSSSSLLDDDRVLRSLEDIKAQAAAVAVQLAAASTVLARVAAVQAAYEPTARAVSQAYFGLLRLPSACGAPLYAWELNGFMAAVERGLAGHAHAYGASAAARANGDEDDEDDEDEDATALEEAGLASAPPPCPDRLAALTLALMRGVWAPVARGLYEQHSHAWGLRVVHWAVGALGAIVRASAPGAAPPAAAVTDGQLELGLVSAACGHLLAAPGSPASASSTSASSASSLFMTLRTLRIADATGAPWQRALSASLAAPASAPQWQALAAGQSSGLPSGWEDAVAPGAPRSGTTAASVLAPALDRSLAALRRLAVAAVMRPDLSLRLLSEAVSAVLAAPAATTEQQQQASASGAPASTQLGVTPDSLAAAVVLEASPSRPTLLLCTPGADADGIAASAATLAAAGAFPCPPHKRTSALPLPQQGGRVRSVALGSSQSEKAAEALLPVAMREGTWLLLRNVHYAPQWLAALLKRLQAHAGAEGGGSCHPAFRLLVTAEVPLLLLPHASSPSTSTPAATVGPSSAAPPLPPAVVRGCVKVLLESHAGLRASVTQGVRLLARSQHHHAFAARAGGAAGAQAAAEALAVSSRLRMLLCWTHAVILERRRYVPLGWSRVYDVGDSDLEAASASADALEASWVGTHGSDSYRPGGALQRWAQLLPALRKLLVEAVYGARLENDADAGILATLIERLLTREALCGPGHPLTLAHGPASGAGGPVSPPMGLPDASAYAEWASTALPAATPPEWLGLPPSADAQLQARAARDVVARWRALVAERDASGAPEGVGEAASAAASGGTGQQPGGPSDGIRAAVIAWASKRTTSLPNPETLARLAGDGSDGAGGGTDPLAPCLHREAHSLASALRLVQAQLAAVAALGNGAASASVAAVAAAAAAAGADGPHASLEAICGGGVPVQWASAAPIATSAQPPTDAAAAASTLPHPCLSAADAWVRALSRRVQHLLELLTAMARYGPDGLARSQGSKAASTPAVDLRCFTHPDAVLTAMRQAAASRLQAADAGSLSVRVTLLAPSAPLPAASRGAVSFLVSGVALQAAVAVPAEAGTQRLAWDAPASAHSNDPAAVATATLDRVVVTFHIGSGGDARAAHASSGGDTTVSLPLYADTARRKLLCTLPLPVASSGGGAGSSSGVTPAERGAWLLRGAALTLAPLGAR